LKALDGTCLLIGNLHVIAGSKRIPATADQPARSHKIPGSGEAALRFKMSNVRAALSILRRSTWHEKGTRVLRVVGGDFNTPSAAEVGRLMEQGGAVYSGISGECLAAKFVREPGPKQRDWLLSDGQLAAVDCGLILAHDRMHAAVVADLTLPPAPPAQRGTPKSEEALFTAALRRRLLEARAAQAQRLEEADRQQEEEGKEEEEEEEHEATA